MRVVAPAPGCVEVDGLSGRRYQAKGGFYEMSDRDGRALVAAGGFVPTLGPTAGSQVGFPCACGFASLFRRCSRCGTENGARRAGEA